jgi:thiamine pyrophosphate-dependent acetolactate synthase large subunit-like protein
VRCGRTWDCRCAAASAGGDARRRRQLDEFETNARRALNNPGHYFIVAKVEKGSVDNLPTLTLDGKEGKYRFARYIESSEGVQILRPRYTHI